MRRSLACTVVAAVLWTATAVANPLESVMSTPQARIQAGDFTMRARVLDSAAPGWTCRLYFDTDLNSFTGWLPSRGYEYVACPDGGGVAVRHCLVSSSDGLGDMCGYGSMQMWNHGFSLSVPLQVLGPSNGRLAWELMVFDANGTWLGSYGGRFVQ